MPQGPTGSPDTDIAKIQQRYQAVLLEEAGIADAHLSNGTFMTSRGRNVGSDELIAVHYAGEIKLTPSADELTDAPQYLRRLLDDLEAIKSRFRVSEDDPEGFGIGTLHSISRKMSVALA